MVDRSMHVMPDVGDGPSQTQRLPRSADIDEAEIVRLRDVASRVVHARVRDRRLAEELAQDATVRLIGALERGAVDNPEHYAARLANNVVRGHWRILDRQRRNLHRLAPSSTSDSAEATLVADEERAALRQALAALPAGGCQDLIAHEVDGVSTAVLALHRQSTPGAVAASLARSRARLRVEFVLTLRHVDLPSQRCKPVLLSISAGDGRRQQSMDAAGHLTECATCTDLAPALRDRSRALAAVMSGAVGLPRMARDPRFQAAAAGGLAAVAAAAILLLGTTSTARTDSQPPTVRAAQTAEASPPRSPAVQDTPAAVAPTDGTVAAVAASDGLATQSPTRPAASTTPRQSAAAPPQERGLRIELPDGSARSVDGPLVDVIEEPACAPLDTLAATAPGTPACESHDREADLLP